MPSISIRARHLVFIALVLLPAGCGRTPSAPESATDRIPPLAPDPARITTEIPRDGTTRVVGSSGSVEPRATVEVLNLETSERRTAESSAEGRFDLVVPASLGDRLSIAARDAAGNASETVEISAGPPLDQVHVRIDDGGTQIGVAGEPLQFPLTIRVSTDGEPIPDVEVRFEAGGGGVVDPARGTTDDGGRARTTLRLGPEPGPQPVRATIFDGGPGHEIVFPTSAVDPPTIDRFEPAPAAPGETITIHGGTFSLLGIQNAVEIAGREVPVLESTPSTLVVEVPPDLTADAVEVRVALAGIPGPSAVLDLAHLPVPLSPLGRVVPQPSPAGRGSLTLPFQSGSEEYVVGFELIGEGASLTTIELEMDPATTVALVPATEAGPEEDLEESIEREGLRLLARYGTARVRRRPLVPAVTTTFHTLSGPRDARLAYDGDHVSLFVDTAVTDTAFPASLARSIGQGFDERVYDRAREVFGEESDVDGNGKVFLFFTPVVNEIGGGVFLGWFGSGDLSDAPTSNRAEIAYVMVPDPEGRFGGATEPPAALARKLLYVSAHEYVHMIVTNERILERGLRGHAGWLNEGLAHLGEVLTGVGGERTVTAYLARASNETSVLGGGGNSERGGVTSFLLRIVERYGEEAIRRLTIEPRRDAGAVESAIGVPLGEIFHDFAVALYGSMYPIPGLDPMYATPSLPELYFQVADPSQRDLALRPIRASPGSGTAGFAMRQGSVAYLVVRGEHRLSVAEVGFEALGDGELRVWSVRARD